MIVQCLHKTRKSLHWHFFISGTESLRSQFYRCLGALYSHLSGPWMSLNDTKNHPYFVFKCLLIGFLFLSNFFFVRTGDLGNCPLVIMTLIYTFLVPLLVRMFTTSITSWKVCRGQEFILMSFPPRHTNSFCVKFYQFTTNPLTHSIRSHSSNTIKTTFNMHTQKTIIKSTKFF